MSWPNAWSEWSDAAWSRLVTSQPVLVGDVLTVLLGATAQRLDELAKWIDAVRRREIPYQEYLQSEWWQSVRGARLAYAGWRCEYHDWRTGVRCQAGSDLNVHHLTYEHLGDENWQTELIVLCRPHHYSIHDGSWKK
jgi:hypothetical protein